MEISWSCSLLNQQQQHPGSYLAASGTAALRPPSTARTVASAAFCSFRTEFSDKGHLQYYAGKEKNTFRVMEKNKKKEKQKRSIKSLSTKQKLKLLRSFSESLASFDGGSELDQQQTNLLSEAAEMFLERLKQMREEEKEQEERTVAESESESSSSSSSSSSESDGDECRKRSTTSTTMTTSTCGSTLEDKTSISTSKPMSTKEGSEVEVVQVCMGNKCKKFGAEALMAEFRSQSTEVIVQPCKCMGKCRSAPNVRVSNHQQEPNHNPLFLGVSLHDVPSILDSLFAAPHTPTALQS